MSFSDARGARPRRASRWLFALGLLGVGQLAAACGSSSGATPARVCTPDAYVFCRCQDFSEGTKQCASDGQSFGECGPCLPDVDTGSVDTALPPDDTTPLADATDAEDTAAAPDTTSVEAAPDAPADPATACPGKVLAVDGTKDTEVTDTTATSLASNVGGGACAVATSRERVYAIIPTGSGKLTVKMTGGAGMDPTLYARDTDCATGKQLACGETTGAGGTETLSFNVLTGKTYYVFADGKAGSEGSFILTFHLAPGPFCGDGKIDTGEACDDGNKVALDGCGNACSPEGDPTSADTCPGLETHVWPGATVSIAGSTATYAGDYGSTGCTGTGLDRVYAVTSHVTGTMTAKITATGTATTSPLIYARSGACASGTELACANKTKTPPDTISWPVTSGSTYYVFVDGYGGWKGAFTLDLSAL
jgi:cysteine-rich repeat protein